MRRPTRITLTIAAVGIATGLVWYVLFGYTPLSNMLPRRLDIGMRQEYARLAAKVDSISEIAAVNDQYARNIEILLADSLLINDTDTVAETNLYDLPLDSLMQAGKAEERFVKQFEASERYNLSVLAPLAGEGMVFYPPVSGVSLRSNAPETEIPSVTINTNASTPVSAIYRGTVVDAYYSTGRGVTVTIQHPNNFISQYSGLGDVFVSRGAKVKAGQRIGMAADERYPLTFMLWHEGSALDPGDYIVEPRTTRAIETEPFIPTKWRR